MNRRTMFDFFVLAAALVLMSDTAVAQQKSLKEQIVGSWTYVLNETVRPDGTKSLTFGPNPSGLVIFGADGRYVSLVGPRPYLKYRIETASISALE